MLVRGIWNRVAAAVLFVGVFTPLACLGMKVVVSDGKQPVPAGAKLVLTSDQPEYFLGENILITFTLTNEGKEPFIISVGGDYRGTGYQLRYRFTVLDEKGQTLPNPFPDAVNFGGVLQGYEILPGESFETSLALMQYWQFDTPGLYTIRVTHDLGWDATTGKLPVGEIKLRLKMPNAEEAEKVVKAMEVLPEQKALHMNQKHPNYEDWHCLRYPVYLKPVLQRAKFRQLKTLDAIGSIPTPEATQALITLVRESNWEYRTKAAELLARRLPEPQRSSRLKNRWYFNLKRQQHLEKLAQQSWKPSLQDEVRALALEWIRNPDSKAVALGARMLQCVEKTEDAPQIFEALERALSATFSSRSGATDNILNFPSPIYELLSATELLYDKGYELKPDGQARTLAYFDYLAVIRPPEMPEDWLTTMDIHASSGSYAIREMALYSMPQPAPDSCVKYVKLGLKDSDLGVVQAACRMAGTSKRSELLQPVLDVLRTSHHRWLMQAAADAAVTLNGQYEVWTI
ncbi:MAG: hypothetical protein B9S32_13315 [Verrucomicrobia bacterium Tous-C9LFEB]|nr:MAG: hypothetical protein B9S32_13315 [Verrucomicrobia bacterium Tous-C9LFEB]